VDVLAEARSAGVDRVIETLATVAQDACKDTEARAYVLGLSGEARAAVAELVDKAAKLEEAARMVQAGEMDRQSIDVERREMRAAIERCGGAQ
jgi:hypothetical protein